MLLAQSIPAQKTPQKRQHRILEKNMVLHDGAKVGFCILDSRPPSHLVRQNTLRSLADTACQYMPKTRANTIGLEGHLSEGASVQRTREFLFDIWEACS